MPWWTVTPFAADPTAGEAADDFGADGDVTNLALEDDSLLAAAKAAPTYRGDTASAIEDVRGWLAGGWRVLLVTEGHGPAQRLAEVLRDADVGVRFTGAEPDGPVETVGCLAAPRPLFFLPFSVFRLIAERSAAGWPMPRRS